MSKMKLTWGEIKEIESFYVLTDTWIEEHRPLLEEIAGRAMAIDLGSIMALSSAQDALALTFLHTMSNFSHSVELLQQLVREAKKECGVQLDAGTVQQSVQEMFQDIRNSLEKK